jgi:hypothetical protein
MNGCSVNRCRSAVHRVERPIRVREVRQGDEMDEGGVR